MDQIPQLARFGLFDARVPRYTSYPTAPQFRDAVKEEKFLSWVRSIRPGSQISLYLHVPFCRRLCWFCACRTQGTRNDDAVRSYADTLMAELRLLKENLADGVTLSRLHWGGGTPTLLPPESIASLAHAIATVTPLGAGAEFSVEIDPKEIDEARLDALAAAGMTRASIGIQDFDPDIQKIIGREQSYETTERAIMMIRARGITSLNTDILYGLPNQTPGRIADSVQKLLSLSPDRVALYGYAHVPWMARRQTLIPSDAIPTPEERLRLFETARKLFVWDGYAEIGIDHFARPGDGLEVASRTGKLRRNFQGYTDDTAPVLIGLGASAISKFPQGYAQNAPATSEYVKSIREGHFSTARGHAFSSEDVWRARVIEALMCDFAVSRDELVRDYGLPTATAESLFNAAAAAFPGMLVATRDRLSIPPHARPLTRMIARHFDAYDLSKAGHSPAV